MRKEGRRARRSEKGSARVVCRAPSRRAAVPFGIHVGSVPPGSWFQDGSLSTPCPLLQGRAAVAIFCLWSSRLRAASSPSLLPFLPPVLSLPPVPPSFSAPIPTSYVRFSFWVSLFMLWRLGMILLCADCGRH